MSSSDTRVIVHLFHALKAWYIYNTIVVRTVDTDIIVILGGQFHDLQALSPELILRHG